jgi:hypothetical protein
LRPRVDQPERGFVAKHDTLPVLSGP